MLRFHLCQGGTWVGLVLMVSINKHNPQIDSLDKLAAFVHSAYQENKNFFGQDIEGIGVNILYSREEMNQVAGRETADWVVGYSRGNLINIFSPAVFEKVASRPASDFLPILTHEMTHVFMRKILRDYMNQFPIWFREGICGYVAKQYEKYKFKKIKTYKFSDISYSKDWNKKPNYPQAFLFTKYLIEKFGKNTILDLLKLPSQERSSPDFPKVFKEITRSDFSEVADNWLKTVSSVNIPEK